MGRDSYSICEDCKVYQRNGYGSYSTWMDDHATVAAFDADVSGFARYGKNQNHRAFLVAHDGHKVAWTSSDCWYHDDDSKILDGLREAPAAGWVDPDEPAPSPTNDKEKKS